MDELRRIEFLVGLEVERFRAAGRTPGDPFRGLLVTEDDVDALLAGTASRVEAITQPQQREGPRPPRPSSLSSCSQSSRIDSRGSRGAGSPAPRSVADLLRSLEEDIDTRRATALAQGTELRLERLTGCFELSDLERDALLVGLAPEIDLRYERLYAYLQDDVTRKRPTVDLILSLLCPAFGDRLAARAAFAADSPLLRHHLLEVVGDTSDRSSPLLARSLRVNDRIVDYLLGRDTVDARLQPIVRWAMPDMTWFDLSLTEETKTRLVRLAEWYREDKGQGKARNLILLLHGPNGVGKQAVAQAICRELGTWLLVVRVRALLSDDRPFETAVQLACREAVLHQVPLYWEGFDSLLGDEERARSCRHSLFRELASLSGLTFLASSSSWEPRDAVNGTPFVNVELAVPPYHARRALWERQLSDQAAESVDIHALANQFRFGAGQIRHAVASARNRAFWRNPGDGRITMADLLDGCRAHSRHKLGSLTQHVRPVYAWDDIVLPPDQLAQLREICSAVRHQPTVYTEWGFGQKLTRGKGINALFTGPSGTGKTMAAEIIAGELGLDLYKIDLSCVVSKYIGETEKNLAKVFREAETSNAILFFDEADALFGKRSEVKDSHDRYANIEINYLLQKMEEHEGIVILASNFRKNIDEAFARRMRFRVDFPFPDEEYRLRIWQSVFPEDTPTSEDIDWGFLARKLKISGGNIRNVALHAAFLAAEGSGVVTMGDVMRATKREYQKIGRLCAQPDFGKYHGLVAGEQG